MNTAMMKNRVFAALVIFLGMISCNQFKNLTWTSDTAQIVHAKCSPCHNNNESGHFKLLTLEDVKSKSGMIKYVIEKGMMPPWPADPHYSSFSQELALSKDEKEKMLLWIDAGCPKGRGEVEIPEFGNSFYGKPDMTVPVKPIFIEGDGKDKFLVVKVPLELESDAYAQCIEFVPGNGNLVHHVNGDLIVYDDSKSKDLHGGKMIVPTEGEWSGLRLYEELDLPYEDGSYPTMVKSAVNYLPGVYPSYYPDELGGFALKKKNIILLNDIHYGGIDQSSWDSSYINIYFRKTPPTRTVKEFQMGTLGISPIEPALIIPPNEVSSYITRYTLPQDISILTINPHMHLLGQSFWAFAYQGKDTIPLIKIPRWDFNWQYFYTFTHPVKIPKGYTILAKGVFDNTSKNIFNPNSPPKVVSDNNASMSTSDEMFQFIINFVDYQEGDENIDLRDHAHSVLVAD